MDHTRLKVGAYKVDLLQEGNEKRGIILAGFVMLALLLVVAYIVPMLEILPLDKIREEVVSVLSAPLGMGSDLGICVYIFLKNTLALLLIAFLSPLLFGLPLLIFVLTNGVIMGVVLADALQNGIPVAVLVGGILPHGVFELTAVAIALGLGYRQTRKFFRTIKARNFLPDNLALKMFVSVIIPLLVVAAIIETWVTPAVMDALMRMTL